MEHIHVCDQPHNYWYEYIYNKYYPNSPHNSKHVFDIYTLTHIFWSLLIIFIIRVFVPQFYDNNILIGITVMTTLFEYHENTIEQIKKYKRIEIDQSGQSSYRGDSTINIIGDILGNISGVYIGHILPLQTIGIILLLLIIILLNVVGINYFIEFFSFMFK